MVNAQKWLDENYPKEIRSEIKQLYLKKKDLEGSLDLSDFVDLQSLHCANNQLTSLNLTGLKNLEIVSCRDNYLDDFDFSSLVPEKVTYLDLRNNNFSEQDLSAFSDFVNLRLLWIGNDDREKMVRNIYNRFIGSLKSLKKLVNLKSLYINNTDIDSGVKYLPSDIQEINYSIEKRKESKISKIEQELSLFFSFKDKGEDWKNIHLDFTEQVKKHWKDLGFYYPEVKEWMKVGLSPSEYHFVAHLRARGYNPQQDLNWEELRKKNRSAQEWLNREYPLEKRKWVTWLDISRSGLEESLIIENFPNLERLDCYRNQFTSMGLKNLPKLVFFDVTNNQLADLVINNCPTLADFYASNNCLARLDFLESLNPDRLNKLYIDNNDFLPCDLSFFSKFKNLKNLHLLNNRFYGSLRSLSNLNKLEELGVSDTKINSDFECLPGSLKEFWYSAGKEENAKISLFANEQGIVEKTGRGSIKNFPQKLYGYKQWINLGFSEQEKESWINAGLKLNEAELSDCFRQKGYQPNVSNIKELVTQESWRNIHPDFNYLLRKAWEKRGFDIEQVQEWIKVGTKPNDYEFIVWLRNVKKVNPGWVQNNQEEFQDLRDKYKYFGTCKECRQPNVGSNWCQTCNKKHWKANFSGNQVIDQFIQKHQLEATDSWNVLEWIPYEQFKDVKHIADGGFGKVYKANWQDGPIRKWSVKHNKWKRETSKTVALKSLNDSRNVDKHFLPELSYYKMFKSETSNMVPCFGVSGNTEGDYVMVMQYMPEGNLREYLQKNHRELSFEDKFERLIDIAQGLKWIHDRGLVHRDFHSGNILYPPCKIADLGLCRPVNETSQEKVFGVMPYVAPEVLRQQPYTQASDVYSFGIISYEVLSGLLPYYDRSHDVNLVLAICQGQRPKFNIKIPSLLEDLIKRCWDANPKKRPTVSELSKQLSDLQGYGSDVYKKFQKQLREAEEHNKTLSDGVKRLDLTKKIHSGAVYTSRLLPTKEIIQLLQNSQEITASDNSSTIIDYSNSLAFDFTSLNLKNQTEQSQVSIEQSFDNWQNIHSSFTEELIKKWQNLGFATEQCQEWINTIPQSQQIQAIQEPEFYAWLRDKGYTPEQLLNNNDIDVNTLKVEFEQSQQTAQILQTNLPNLPNK